MMFKVLSLFSGIGAFEKALTNLGVQFQITNYCEIDKYTSKAYASIHNVQESINLGDITKIDIKSLDVNIDLITHGSPCQDFSIAGNQKGGDKDSGTRSSLMWKSVEIIQYVKPKYIIWENVKNLLSTTHKHNFDSYLKLMKDLGYNNYYQVLNSINYNIPQEREREFVVSIKSNLDDMKFVFPKPVPLTLKLENLLEKEVDEKYFLTEKKCVNKKYNYGNKRLNETLEQNIVGNFYFIDAYNKTVKKDKVGTITTRISGSNCSFISIKKNDILRIRKLTPKECFRLMGFSDDDFQKVYETGVPDSSLYVMAGNSIVVKVLEHIFVNLLGNDLLTSNQIQKTKLKKYLF